LSPEASSSTSRATSAPIGRGGGIKHPGEHAQEGGVVGAEIEIENDASSFLEE